MDTGIFFTLIVIVLLACGCTGTQQGQAAATAVPSTPNAPAVTAAAGNSTAIPLTDPESDSSTSVEKALKNGGASGDSRTTG